MLFNPNTVAPSEDLSPIPSGEYVAIIVDSGCKPTKNNAGHYLELVYQVIDGQFKGRKVWARFNFDNANADAVRIGMEQLSAVCHACGNLAEFNPYNGAQHLHNIAHVIRVELQKANPAKNRERDSNEVKAWKKAGGVVQQAPAQPAAAAPAPQQAGAAPTWAQQPKAA